MLPPPDAAHPDEALRPAVLARLRPMALLALTALLTACAGHGFLRSGMPHGHDTICHAISTVEYARCFQLGAWWPRWLPDLSGGYGGPDPLFYAPLVFQLTGRLAAAGLTVTAALKVVALLAVALSVPGMFLWAEGIWGWPGGLLATTIYLFSPYHLCDLYTRFALPELVGMGLAPWLFLWTRRHMDGDRHAARWLALALAALIGVHSLSVVLYGGLLALYVAGLAARSPDRSRLCGLVKSVLAAVALSAPFWVPVIAESNGLWFVHNGFSERVWPHSFLSAGQLVDEPWYGAVGPMPLHIGRPMLYLSALALFVAAALYATRSPGILPWWGFAFGVAVHGLLATELARPLWEHSPLPLLEFPWRFLAPVSLGIAVLVPIIFRPIEGRPLLSPALHTLVVAGVIWTALPLCTAPADPAAWPTPESLTRDNRTATHYPMYVPAAGRPPLFPARARFSIGAGEGTVPRTSELPDGFSAHVAARTPVVLEVRVYDYEGWTATIDDEPASILREESNGGMRLQLPQGEHEVRMRFGFTPLRALSCATAACAALFVFAPAGWLATLAASAATVSTLACAGALALRVTPLGPRFFADRAQTQLELQRYDDAVRLLEQVPTGTSRYQWARAKLDELAYGGYTTATFAHADLASAPAIGRRHDLLIDPSVSWSLPSPAPFTMTAAARVDLPADGEYAFTIESVGAAAIWVDRALVAGSADEHGLIHEDAHVTLSRGQHDLAVFYRTRGPEVALRVTWTPPGKIDGPLPLSALRPGQALLAPALIALPGHGPAEVPR